MRTLILPLVVVAALAAALVVGRGGPSAPAAPDAGLRFPTGQALRYRLVHTGHHRVAPTALGSAPAIVADADLALDVTLRGVGRVDGAWRVALGFGAIERASLVVGGQDALGDAAAWRGLEATLDVAPSGAVQGVRFPAGAPAPFRTLVQLILTETQIRLGEGTTWTVPETTQHGVARSVYTQADGHLTRTRAGYDRLQAVPDGEAEVDGRATVTLEDGHVRRLAAEETLRARAAGRSALEARTETRFELVAVVADERPAPRGLVAARLGEGAEVADHDARLLADRIDGLTPEALEAMLRGAAQSGRLPDHNRSLWRAVGLLRSDDGLCASLAELAAAADASSAGRGLVLDLLTSAGTPAAQAALRDALGAESVRQDPKFPLLFQRLSLITLPDAETLAYLEAHYDAPGGETLGAAAFALGAAAGRTARAGDAQGRALADRLLADLEAAQTPDQQAVRLIALGNAGLPDHQDALLPFARAEDPEVRRAAAASLRKLETPAARAALLELAGDAEIRVQRRALESLGRQGARPEELAPLARLAGTTAEPALDLLVDLAAPHAQSPGGRAILDAILGRKLRDARIKSRIRALLGAG
ncbi:MAG: HEAT repeat domain-containing protein [Myxococcales bacterium]|nr:HEAT repeat domain-containing protein [Myxococcales bacterium]